MNTLGLGRYVYTFGLGAPYAQEVAAPSGGGGYTTGRWEKPYQLPDWLDDKEIQTRIMEDDQEVLEIIMTMITRGMF